MTDLAGSDPDTSDSSDDSLAEVRAISTTAELHAARERIADLEADVSVAFRLAIDLREAHGKIADLELAAQQHSITINELRYTRLRVTRLMQDLADSENKLADALARIEELSGRTQNPKGPRRRRTDKPTGALQLFKRPPAKPDDLKLIRGIGPSLESGLNRAGVFTFAQLAGLNDGGLAELAELMPELKNRPIRDRWVEQARTLRTP